jgi:hypothetical protein
MAEGIASRQPAVVEEITHVSCSVDVVHQMVNELEKRLEPILRREEPSPEGPKDPSVPPPRTPIGDAIRDINSKVEVEVRRLKVILQRIEV